MPQNTGILYILTYKCASRHSGVQFFNISTSKSVAKHRYFVHFDLQMCFSPQRRAIFQHLNFKKCSEHAVFCTFSLQNMLLATAACNFSTSQLQKLLRTCSERHILIENVLLATAACNFSTAQLQKVLRDRQSFNILTWKCASRHSGVQFFNINFKKCSEHAVFCTFSLQNVFLATAACNFSTSQLQKLLRTCSERHRHSGVQFFMSPLTT